MLQLEGISAFLQALIFAGFQSLLRINQVGLTCIASIGQLLHVIKLRAQRGDTGSHLAFSCPQSE